nr:zinc metalloproteinase nas-1-like [Procambarus clarkii]
MLVNKLVVVTWAAVLVGLGTAAPAGGSSLVLMDHTQDSRLQDSRHQDGRLQDGRLQDARIQDARFQDTLPLDDRLQESFSRDNLKPLSDERSNEKEAKKRKKTQGEKEKRYMARYLKKRWPENVIPVMIDKERPPLKEEMVHEGIAMFNKLTCLYFYNTTDTDEYYLRITSRSKDGCFAHLGFQNQDRGFQDANFSPGCFYSISVILHELSHGLGFNHHQSRVDRDEYVTINFTNIGKGKTRSFTKVTGKADYLSTLGLPYQYNSVMHYSIYAFTKGSEFGSTITLNRNFPGEPGKGNGFARIDVASINRYYECWDYYLGDDIPGSVPYADFHAFFMRPKRRRRKSTEALRTWIYRMRNKYSQ